MKDKEHYKGTLKNLRSRYNRVSNLFGEFERLSALKRAIDRDRENGKRKQSNEYYDNIRDRMDVIIIKLDKHLPLLIEKDEKK